MVEQIFQPTGFITERRSSTSPPFFNGSNYSFLKGNMQLQLKSQDTRIWRVIIDIDYILMVTEEDETKVEKSEDTLTRVEQESMLLSMQKTHTHIN